MVEKTEAKKARALYAEDKLFKKFDAWRKSTRGRSDKGVKGKEYEKN